MKWFRVKKPKDLMSQFSGMTITAYPTAEDALLRSKGELITIEHIAGNFRHQTMFQINHSHLVSMLDAYSELNGDPLPPYDLHQDFLSTTCEHIEKEQKEKPKLSLIDRNPTHG